MRYLFKKCNKQVGKKMFLLSTELCARSTEILNLWPRRIMAEQKDTSSGVNTDYFQQGQLTQLAPMQHYENTRYQQGQLMLLLKWVNRSGNHTSAI